MTKTTVLIWLISFSLHAQDTLDVTRLQFNGYLKELVSYSFQNNFTHPVGGNLIHNRLNFKWQPSATFTGAIEFRNRVFSGEQVRVTPEFASQFRNPSEIADMSLVWIDTRDVVAISVIDRFWIEYRREKWHARAGRQRINWGMGTTWNPNDLFNTYNFLDFDYEERPAVDAIKLQYATGPMDHVEAAASFQKGLENMIAAVKYFTNVANYDLQFIAGMFYEQPTLGVGWSGNIKDGGFKGEVQYYFKAHELHDLFNVVVEADYVFENGWYIGAGTLYNSQGTTKSTSLWEVSSFHFSPQTLMPTKWNFMFSSSKEITPLFSLTTTFVYAPVTNLLFILPSFTYGLVSNVDLSFVWQSYFSEQPYGFDDVGHQCFLRLKWSF